MDTLAIHVIDTKRGAPLPAPAYHAGVFCKEDAYQIFLNVPGIVVICFNALNSTYAFTTSYSEAEAFYNLL